MPFGLTNAPVVFTELMSIVSEDFAIAYLDDILVVSSTFEEHLKHTQIIFDRLRHDLKLKLKKCEFFLKEKKYFRIYYQST